MTLPEEIRIRILGLWTEVAGELPADTSTRQIAQAVQARIQAETGRTIGLSTVKRLHLRSLSPAQAKERSPKIHENPGILALVQDLVSSSPDEQVSCRKLAARAGISKSSMHLVLRKGLRLFPYRLGEGQTLEEGHISMRLSACRVLQQRAAGDESFWRKIYFSDECYITLDRHVNSQNDRMWRPKGERPGVVATHVAHPDKLSIFVALKFGCRPIFWFFEEEANGVTRNVNVNSQNYIDMMRNHVIPIIKANREDPAYGQQTSTRIPRRHDWSLDIFQQDGASAHNSKRTIDFLYSNFKEVITLRAQEKNGKKLVWPPRSPDLNPLDFWLWSFLKERVWAGDQPTTRDQLRQKVVFVLQSIPQQMIDNACLRFKTVVDLCVEAGGHHFDKDGHATATPPLDDGHPLVAGFPMEAESDSESD